MLGLKPLVSIPIALVKDLHYWGLRPLRASVPVVQPSNGEELAVPSSHWVAKTAENNTVDKSNIENPQLVSGGNTPTTYGRRSGRTRAGPAQVPDEVGRLFASR